MNPELKKRLESIVSKLMIDGYLETHELRFLRARASYLSKEQLTKLNSLLKAEPEMGEVKKKDLQNIEPVIEVTIPEEPVEPAESDDVEVVEDEDLPEDSGELEIIDEADELEAEDEDLDEEVDIENMNLNQLKAVAKDLGIAGYALFRSEKSLREKIYATYESSEEAQAEA